MSEDRYPVPTHAELLKALAFAVPLFDQTGLPWIITGGFACYVYGVERDLSDIDIDLDCGHAHPAFQSLLQTLEPFITMPLTHYTSDRYDNYNAEAVIDNTLFDFCSGDDLKVFDPATGRHELFYAAGFPQPVRVNFHGFNLPLLPPDLIIANKRQLMRPIDITDIAGLEKRV